MGENKNLGIYIKELTNRTLLIFLFLLLLVLTSLIIYFTQVNVKSEKIDTTRDVYVNSLEGLNLRKDPSFYAQSLDVLPHLSKLNIVRTESDWVEVNYDDQSGWVYMKFLTNEKPQEFSVRDLDYKNLINTRSDYTQILDPIYADYNQDGREDVLLTVVSEGISEQKDYYIYSYEKGYTLKKILVINPTLKPELYSSGYRGFSNLVYTNEEIVFSYPEYVEIDGLCCPTGGITEKHFVWDGEIFALKN